MRTLKLFRQLRGKSQFELGAETGIPNYRLSRLENGRDEPTSEELAKLAEALNTTPSQLQRDVEDLLEAV